MHTGSIWRVALATPLRRLFDYLPPLDWEGGEPMAGIRVRVPFGARSLVGIVIEASHGSDIAAHKLKRVTEVLDTTPIFSAPMLEFCQFVSRYYHHALGEVMMMALPTRLRQGKPYTVKAGTAAKNSGETTPAPPLALNVAQQQAVTTICAQNDFHVSVLQGVTGSGKTEVYLQSIQYFVARGLQALVLVPEISLTPQTVARFAERFQAQIAVFHSGLTEKERFESWARAASGEAAILIGTRSALFTPIPRLGVIVLDEEHDLSFKQQDNLRYSARDCAIVRAKQSNIPIVLGSATPSLETLQQVVAGRYQCLELPMRVNEQALPKVHVIDIRNQKLDEGLSKPLLGKITEHLQDDHQVLLFLNRRGFAPTLMCHACGWIAECTRCDARLVMHKKSHEMRCHHCGKVEGLPKQCPKCHERQFVPLGVGTERLETALQKFFPDIDIIRIDSDSTKKKESLQQILATVANGKKQILIGTQMVAKGHDFPNLTLVVILDVDSGFYSADFRNLERMGQLLTQVGGRAGRGETKGEVILQTRHPEHPLLQRLLQEGYATFAQEALYERSVIGLPPYSYLAIFRAEAKSEAQSLNFLKEVQVLLQQYRIPALSILGPIAAPMTRKAGFFRAQLMLQAKERATLHSVLKKIVVKIEELPSARRVRWSLDVDPLEMFC
jgi:primosomal protein N' (replication factor Y)